MAFLNVTEISLSSSGALINYIWKTSEETFSVCYLVPYVNLRCRSVPEYFYNNGKAIPIGILISYGEGYSPNVSSV